MSPQSLQVCPFTSILLLLPCAALAYQQSRKSESRSPGSALLRHRSGVQAKLEELQAYVPSWQQKTVNCSFLAYCVSFTVITLALFACLLGASAASMGGELQFMEACFLSVLAVRDLTPNTGLFWSSSDITRSSSSPSMRTSCSIRLLGTNLVVNSRDNRCTE
eukprot:Skav236691  [mRNA]  locus=scaffold847:261942:268554:- [translate_table: standard]